MLVRPLLKGCLGFFGALLGLLKNETGLLESLSGALSGLIEAGPDQVRYTRA